jgi:serine/threonine protein phosphatase PrpC
MSTASHEPSDLASPLFQTGANTHVGYVRSKNEDHYLVRADIGLWAVSDGMGGHVAGAFASAAIVEALKVLPLAHTAVELLSGCEHGLSLANRRIRTFAAEHAGATVGATVAVLLAFGEHYACLWCGDSRVSLIRDGEIRQVSRDHSEVQELVDHGAISAEEAKSWPGRNVLTRAVGVADEIETDMVEGALHQGDIFVLCSDGLTGHVADEEICRIALRRPPEASCQDMIDLALQRGGKDNVTVIVVHYRPERTRRVKPASMRGVED